MADTRGDVMIRRRCLSEDSIEELNERIEAMFAEGWKCLAGMSYNIAYRKYSQLMYRSEYGSEE